MKNKFYITTTLPYVNAKLHIGFALEIIQTDAIVRWQKMQGKEVFNTRTDEYGLKIYQKAAAEGKDTQAYGVDALRYYLLTEITPFEDGDFTIEKFETRYNADLANGLGNLVARVSNMLEKASIKISIKSGMDKTLIKSLTKEMNEYQCNNALNVLWDELKKSDEILSAKKPWELDDKNISTKKSLSQSHRVFLT